MGDPSAMGLGAMRDESCLFGEGADPMATRVEGIGKEAKQAETSLRVPTVGGYGCGTRSGVEHHVVDSEASAYAGLTVVTPPSLITV